MRQRIDLCQSWLFTGPDHQQTAVALPHTWNSADGQDGGNDYQRGSFRYERTFKRPSFDSSAQEAWLEFEGVNASAQVTLNGEAVCSHDGGYSTFRGEVTSLLQEENQLVVWVDNSVNDHVYPQKADFTFYGGIYRAVSLILVEKAHFALDYFGSSGVRVTPIPQGEGASVRVESRVTGGEVSVTLLDHQGCAVASGRGADVTLSMATARRWHGVADPYLYICRAEVHSGGRVTDCLEIPFGVRSFRLDPKQGFFLNDKPYPLHGVSRHQDRKGVGNALTRAMHAEDMALIKEMGCNTVRLAHYQHDQYFYDLCDQYGLVVWAEIPYISEHMPAGKENARSQMRELIEQNYNHPGIVCWGISNEITICVKDKKDMLASHRSLNAWVHEMDPIRFTTLACYAMCGPFNRIAHITDTVCWNLYLGWYVPGLFLNDLWMSFFHLCYPKRMLGYSEYGAEGMPNLHSARPRRNDHTEEYQAKYHAFMLRCFKRHPYLWATHVWNMFDFAADARDQGGEPGMNHKGLVTFDRKIKKDSFYLYQAHWSSQPMVHICSKRYAERCEKVTVIRVYATESWVTLYVNGKPFAQQHREDHVFTFRVPLRGEIRVEAVAGKERDSAVFRQAAAPNPSYTLKKPETPQRSNWV